MSVRRALLPALISLLLLTGCGGGQSTADPPLPPPSSSATSPAPKPETPEHFIRRWAAEEARMEQTGETADYRAISRECEGCIRVADHVDRIYAHKGFIHTKGWRVRRIVGLGHSLFKLRVSTPSTVYAESASGPRIRLHAGPSAYQLKLRPEGLSWNVTSLIQVPR